MSVKRWGILGVVLVLGSAATVYGISASRKANTTEGEVITVKRGRIAVSVQEVGSVEPLRKVDIKSKVAGQVLEVLVDVGDRVKQGDPIMKLDPLDANRELREADAKTRLTTSALAVSQAQYDFKKKAHASGALSDLDLSVSEGEVRKLEAQAQLDQVTLQGARDRLNYTHTRSPIDGIVLARNVQPGEMVVPGVSSMVSDKPLLVVAQIEKLLVRTELNQIDVARIKLKDKVEISVDALPGKKFQGEIYRIAAMATKSERRKESNLMVFPVDVIVDRSQQGADALRPGMMADITVALEAKDNTLIVPIEAIVREGGKTRVWRVTPEQKSDTQAEITIGLQNEREVEVLSGLNEGEAIRIRPASADDHTARM